MKYLYRTIYSQFGLKKNINVAHSKYLKKFIADRPILLHSTSSFRGGTELLTNNSFGNNFISKLFTKMSALITNRLFHHFNKNLVFVILY